MMHHRHSRPSALTGALCIAILACGGSKPATRRLEHSPERDDFGDSVVVDASHRPSRIVSLNPTTTEILFAIGAGSRVVGRSTYDVFPGEAKSVTDVGMPLRPNVEAVLAVHPDLVILYASADNRPAAQRFQQAGVRTLALKIDSIAQFERDTRLLGRLTGDSAAAYTLVDSVAATLDRVQAATKNLPRPTVFIPTWDRPLIAIGGGSFLSQLLDIAGARNIYEDIGDTVRRRDHRRRGEEKPRLRDDQPRGRAEHWHRRRNGARCRPSARSTCWSTTRSSSAVRPSRSVPPRARSPTCCIPARFAKRCAHLAGRSSSQR